MILRIKITILFIICLSYNSNYFSQKVIDSYYDSLRKNQYYTSLENEKAYEHLLLLLNDVKKKQKKEYIGYVYTALYRVSVKSKNTDSIKKYQKIIEQDYYDFLTCEDKYDFKLDYAAHSFDIGKYSQTWELFNQAEKLADSCGVSKSLLLMNLARYKYKSGEIKEAIEILKKIIPYEQSQENPGEDMLHYLNYNIGHIFHELNEYDSSIIYIKKAINYKEKVIAYITLCEIYLKINPDEIIKNNYFDKIRKLLKEPNNHNTLISYYTLMAEYSYYEKNYALCEKYADSIAMLKVDEEYYYKSVKESSRYKIKALLKNNGFLVDNLINYIDSSHKDDIKTKAFELEKVYETSEKERTISLLNANIKDKEIKALVFRNYVFYSLVVLAFLFLFYVFIRRQKRKRLSAKMEELRRQALKLQMNPHFFFNSLNSVNSFIVKNEKIEAQKFLTGFSRLMRLTLENSQEDLIPVQKEIEFLERYMELEKQRLKNFDYKLTIDPQIENHLIPSFLLQPIIENSIIHGFRNIDYKGMIEVSFSKKNDKLILSVSDNGVGIQTKSQDNIKNHKSFATKILKDRVKIYKGEVIENENKKSKTGLTITIILPSLNKA